MVNINVLRALVNGNPIPVPFVHQLVNDVLKLQDSLKEKDSIINSLKEELHHEELFGHLSGDEFTAEEASEYLEVSITTFRRYVASGKLQPSATIGRSQLFSVSDLKSFKKARKTAKG